MAADTADSSSDPFTAIQAAIASGAISSTTGQVLENRIAAIERLAATDPGLDANLLESRVLAVLHASSSPMADSSPTADGGSSLLALDSSAIGSGSASSAGAVFAPGASFSGSPAAVPEPSTASGRLGRRRLGFCRMSARRVLQITSTAVGRSGFPRAPAAGNSPKSRLLQSVRSAARRCSTTRRVLHRPGAERSLDEDSQIRRLEAPNQKFLARRGFAGDEIRLATIASEARGRERR